MAKIVALANQKGGVGKTTTAVNLSACIGAAGKRVLLVDSDPQGNATSGFGVDRRQLARSLYEVLIGAASAQEALLTGVVEGVDLLPSAIGLTGAEIEMVELPSREMRLKAALAPLADRYDWIFIDCPPSLGLLTVNALSAAQGILIPMQCEYYALEGLSLLLQTVELVRRGLNPTLHVEGVLLTMVDGRTNLAQQVEAEVRSFFGDKVYTVRIPRNVRLSEAPGFGKPIIYYDVRAAGAEAYLKLAGEVLDGQEGVRQRIVGADTE